MKTKTHIFTLLAFLLCTVTFASTGKDTLAVGKRTRTFATAPVASTISANTEALRISKKSLQPANFKTRSFAALDEKIDVEYELMENTYRSEFSNSYFNELYPISENDSTYLQEVKAKAIAVFNRLDETGNVVDILSIETLLDLVNPLEPIEFPIGLSKTIAGSTYIVGISDAAFYPTYTELTIFVRITIPQSDGQGAQKQLFFGATGIKISNDGGLLGDTNLALLGDYPIPISGGNGALVIKGGFNLETGDIADKTYVTIDCDGFKELSINAQVQFSRNLVVPLKPDYTVDNSNYEGTSIKKRVGADFEIVVSDWNDIMGEVTIPRFALKSQETENEGSAKRSFVFEVNTAVFDFSDIRNADNIVWPPEYEQDYLDTDSPELWKGVYVQSLTVSLPEQFKRKGSTERIELSASNLLIDGQGVSGDFSADNILPLNEGSASKWQFSVDHIEASFIANNFTRAEFRGAIVLPISEEVTDEDVANQQENSSNENTPSAALAYEGLINPATDEYTLTASPTTAIKFNVWKATATIASNSYVRFTVAENKFKPEAMLHGSMGIYADNSDPPGEGVPETPPDPNAKKTVEFEGVTFESLHLKTDSPIFSVAYLGYEGEVKLANFPISIGDIELTTTDNTAKLEFDLMLNLQEDAFGASTRLAVNGTFGEDEGITRWKYQNITFSEISINADIGGAEFEGSITLMDNDPTYGDGFQGNLTARFKGMGSEKVTVSANAIFGKTEFRYWYVDALADGLNVETGTGFTIKGFGGGAFYRMKKAGFSSSFTASGSEYVPDLDSGLGIKAMILFATTGTSRALNGGAGFEIAFNSSGGLNRISIYGEGHVMQDFDIPNPAAKLKGTLAEVVQNEAGFSDAVLDQLKETNLVEVSKQVYPDNVAGEVGLNAYAAIEYDFTTSTLHGTFDLYIDAAGGLFRGRASGNRAGWAVLHFAPDTWYVHMGTPTDRLGLKVGIGGASIESGGYFMLGDNIPASPPPPAVVADILGVQLAELDSMRDENALGNGRGFAFGTDFSLDTGDISFLIFYARLQAGVGFDIMVKDYGTAECNGSGQIGLNGWYANGQAYAYLQGELGVKVRLLFIKKDIPIISAGLAVLMQAKLPNPVWFRGYAGGHFSVLGGLVKGRFRLKVELGEQCEFVDGAPLGGLKIIADIQPGDNTSNVDVFTAPQVGFNMRVNHIFELEDEQGTFTYRIKLKEFEVTNAGVPLVGTTEWNDNNDLLTFVPDDILPPTTDLQIKVSVNFEERVNGVWRILTDNGQEAVETEIRSFTTGEAPDYIPLSNIAYMYPTIDQKFVHKDEYGQAFVQLKTGQDYLFENLEGYTQKAYFVSDQGSEDVTIGYNNSDNKVFLNMPTMSDNLDYTLTMVTEPISSETQGSLTETFTEQNLGEDTEVEVREVTLGQTVINAEAVEMLSFDFHTSVYSTFAAKLASKAYTQPMVEIIYSDVHALHTKSNETERFNLEEVEGTELTNYAPMMRIEADLSNNTYYQNEIYPLIYQNYPISNFTVNRDVSDLGLPPVKAMDLLEWYPVYTTTEPNNYLLRERIPFRYLLPLTFKEDFIDIQYKITNAYLNNSSQYAQHIAQYDYIINGIFPYIKQGNYNTKIKYVLPDGTVTSITDYMYNKPN
ncbi:hypothetical protein [Dokdonia sp. PRO95]|uniref:hypothetical protein n=1 Tax=Dokdonia sp. PRO95 TaxID=1239415 RepID=UPI00068D3DA0|nr:hypothetical protein [Dokdonia sp. PRO95]